MTIESEYTDRFDYLGRSVGRRLVENMRARRKQAVAAVYQYRAEYTLDGTTTRHALFDHRPTQDDLIRQFGAAVVIVAIQRRRHPDRAPVARPQMLPA